MSGLLAACALAIALAQPAQPPVTEPSLQALSAPQDFGELKLANPSYPPSPNLQNPNAPNPNLSNPNPSNLSNRSNLLTASYASFITLEALDAHSTLRAIDKGGREVNPVLRGLAEHPAAFIAVKAAGSATAIWAAEKLRRKHPRGAFALMVVLNSVLATVVAHNYSLQ